MAPGAIAAAASLKRKVDIILEERTKITLSALQLDMGGAGLLRK